MRLFRRGYPADINVIEANFQRELEPDLGILNRSANVVDDVLSRARGNKARLESEIAERQEELRQTAISIEAFEAAQRHLESGFDTPDLSIAAE